MSESSGSPPKMKVSAPVDRVLRDPVREESVMRMWRVIAARRERGQRGRQIGAKSAWVLASVLAVLVAVVGYRVIQRRTSDSRKQETALLTREGKEFKVMEVAPHASISSVTFADASAITAEPGARLVALASTARDFEVLLARGSATFSVNSGGGRRWVVEAGALRVEVVGTRFRVSRSAELVSVSVEKGVVLVRGANVPDGVVRLEAGRSLEVSNRKITPKGDVSAASPAQPPPKSTSDAAMNSHGPERADASANWREAAKRGEHKQAFAELGADGLQRETGKAASAEELFALADIARLSGHPDQALLPLKQLLSSYPNSAQASLANVTIGRIELASGHAESAARAFERALRGSAPAGLEEDVYARLVEAHMRSNNPSAARRVAKEYAERYPNGHREAHIERTLGSDARE